MDIETRKTLIKKRSDLDKRIAWYATSQKIYNMTEEEKQTYVKELMQKRNDIQKRLNE